MPDKKNGKILTKVSTETDAQRRGERARRTKYVAVKILKKKLAVWYERVHGEKIKKR